ncbi:hypothetical protein [Legionella cherrii]|uniref:Uncharacterized protein n=1 Tax=Legionella cherrii TaxID=28084 RepID=A0A0W0S9W0_9GAMM|nr:hypothetical protein [Legionella cherrii]KTC80259.1 hypothetical protein Lche_2279 [Legionella cherrii]VEB38784.1 Uncharacterised protein [Legionella cherrii]
MSKFPNKTAFELRQYFRQLTLEQLLDINHSYGPHFEQLEERIDRCNKDLANAQERLDGLKNRKQVHQNNYGTVETLEAAYRAQLNSVLADYSRTNRFLGRQAAGASPMEQYDYQKLHLDTEISNTSEKIDHLNQLVTGLEQKKTDAISELRILNRVITEKRAVILNQVTAEPSEYRSQLTNRM